MFVLMCVVRSSCCHHCYCLSCLFAASLSSVLSVAVDFYSFLLLLLLLLMLFSLIVLLCHSRLQLHICYKKCLIVEVGVIFRVVTCF
jgi:hypothetical protein